MTDQATLERLLEAIAAADSAAVTALLADAPELARAAAATGATRAGATSHYLTAIQHYVYAGDTALHIAAAAHRPAIVRALVALGADVRARNRRGAEPLHYAADGLPGSPGWDPDAQAATVAALVASGADANAVDGSGVTPLHRAVRTRCAAAVRALLDGGADPLRPNGNGSSPMQLALRATGRGGSGGLEAKAQQAQIVEMLRRAGGV